MLLQKHGFNNGHPQIQEKHSTIQKVINDITLCVSCQYKKCWGKTRIGHIVTESYTYRFQHMRLPTLWKLPINWRNMYSYLLKCPELAHHQKIRNILKFYLTRVCRNRWSRKSSVKIDEITGAFNQHWLGSAVEGNQKRWSSFFLSRISSYINISSEEY